MKDRQRDKHSPEFQLNTKSLNLFFVLSEFFYSKYRRNTISFSYVLRQKKIKKSDVDLLYIRSIQQMADYAYNAKDIWC